MLRRPLAGARGYGGLAAVARLWGSFCAKATAEMYSVSGLTVLLLWAGLLVSCRAALPGQDAPIRTVSEVDATGAERVSQYADTRLAEVGYLDVTKAPYNADPTGRRDATAAIQQAVKDARDARVITYLPAGRYLVSDTIRGIQGTVKRDLWAHEGYSDPWVMHASFEYPCVIKGPSEGDRAILVLADLAPGFGDPREPKPVVHFWSRAEYGPNRQYRGLDKTVPQANINFNQKIVDVDFELGNDNPGAMAINHQGAEGSVVEDVNIDARGAFAGLQNLPGSGGAIHGISVSGGRYGLYVRNDVTPRASQPSPVATSLRLTGQEEAAILYDGNGPLTIVGALIEGAGIVSDCPKNQSVHGALNIVDAVIRVNGEQPAIQGNHSLALYNVYVENAEIAAKISDQWSLPGVKDGWMHIIECVAPAANPAQAWAGGQVRRDSIWIDGEKRDDPVVRTARAVPESPEDSAVRHRWPRPFPTWRSEGAVNVKDAPFNAVGDGVADDADAIQRAIDNHEIVFLPKGRYALSRPLVLGARTKLIGLGNVQTVITALDQSEAFSDPDDPRPLIDTVDDAGAETVLAFMKLKVPVRDPSVYALRWRAGRGSIVRNVYPIREAIHPQGAAMNHPMVRIEGSGGGRWYTNVLLHWWDQGPDYRHLLIEGTREPLAFYMLEPQHGRGATMVEIRDAENIDIFGIKSEGDFGVMDMADSRRIRVFGYSGNGMPFRGYSLFNVTNCRDILFTNISPRFKSPRAYGALGTASDPHHWYILKDRSDGRSGAAIPGTGQFVVYKVGRP